MALFMKSKDNDLINMLLVQALNVEGKVVSFTMKNGTIIDEIYDSEANAQLRYTSARATILQAGGGGSSSEVEELRAQVVSLTAQLSAKNSELAQISAKIDEINGEIV